MANDFLALADMLVINDMNALDIGITDLLDDAPFLRQAPATMSSNGHLHKYLRETGAPSVGFRAANAGREYDSSIDTLITETLTILDASFAIDKAVADSYARGGASALLAREARRHLKAAFFAFELQIFEGTLNGAAAGFAGLPNAASLDAIADGHTVDGGSNTDDVCSSVWGVRWGEMDFSVVLAEGSTIEIGEPSVVMAEEVGTVDTYLPMYFVPISVYVGIQLGSVNSVNRVANIDTTAVLTDDMLSDCLALFPAGKWPDVWVMSRRSWQQLQDSRTATNPTGAPAPFPDQSFNVPIIVTDGILNTEDDVV